MKIFLTKIKKHPIIIAVSLLFSLTLMVIGAIESFTWVYDRFFRDVEQEKILQLSPGISQSFIEHLLGPQEKILQMDGKEVSLWELQNGIIGAIYSNTKVETLFIHSNCRKRIFLSQINFTLCKDKLPSFSGGNYEWDSFLTAQNGGYVEEYLMDRSISYLVTYFGAQRALDLIKYIDENKTYFDHIEEKTLNSYDEMMQEVMSLRKKVKPDLVILSNTPLSISEIIDIYYEGIMNFHFLSS